MLLYTVRSPLPGASNSLVFAELYFRKLGYLLGLGTRIGLGIGIGLGPMAFPKPTVNGSKFGKLRKPWSQYESCTPQVMHS